MSVEIVGPFEERRLVVDGWLVPFVDCHEQDNGRVLFVVDHRLGFEVGPADFDEVARLVAAVYAIGIGLPSFPSDSWFPEDDTTRAAICAGIPHVMRPTRLAEIGSVSTE